MLARIRCFLRGYHNPTRHPLGGFRCLECAETGADLEAMGYEGDGYVSPMRTIFSRERSGLTRTMYWEPTRKGW